MENNTANKKYPTGLVTYIISTFVFWLAFTVYTFIGVTIVRLINK